MGEIMGLFTTIRRFGLQSLGGILTCLLLLPLPVLAYTITWPTGAFTTDSSNVSLNQAPAGANALQMQTPSAFTVTQGTTQTATGQGMVAGSAGEMLSAKLNLGAIVGPGGGNGLTVPANGTLTVAVTVTLANNSTESLFRTLGPGMPANGISLTSNGTNTGSTELALDGSADKITVTFTFASSSGTVLFQYQPATTSNLVFGN